MSKYLDVRDVVRTFEGTQYVVEFAHYDNRLYALPVDLDHIIFPIGEGCQAVTINRIEWAGTVSVKKDESGMWMPPRYFSTYGPDAVRRAERTFDDHKDHITDAAAETLRKMLARAAALVAGQETFADTVRRKNIKQAQRYIPECEKYLERAYRERDEAVEKADKEIQRLLGELHEHRCTVLGVDPSKGSIEQSLDDLIAEVGQNEEPNTMIEALYRFAIAAGGTAGSLHAMPGDIA